MDRLGAEYPDIHFGEVIEDDAKVEEKEFPEDKMGTEDTGDEEMEKTPQDVIDILGVDPKEL